VGADLTIDDLAGPGLHDILAGLRRHEPVAWVPALNGWLVTSRELAVQVMRDPETFTVDDPRFSTAQVVGPSMLSIDGAAHARHRSPFGRAFGLARTQEHFARFVESETARLVGSLAGEAELRRGVAGPLAVAVVAEALGLRDADPGTVLRWYDAIVTTVSDLSAGRPVGTAGAGAFAHLAAHVRRSIGGDSLLATAAAGGALSTDEVVSNAAVLMFGAIETTEGMICNAVYHLLSNAAQLTLVRGDPSLIANALDESLRLEPAAAVVDRYATRETMLGGRRIGERDLVVVSLAGANRDPAAFDQPDAFDVRRSNARQQLAFAHGPHVCVGMHLARLEAHVAVTRLLELPGLRLAEPTPPPTGLVFRKPRALRVRWDRSAHGLL
jgi:cytochrome P450